MWVRHLAFLVVMSLFCWAAIFWYHPLYTYDYILGAPLMDELRQAFWKYGVVDYDFSPYRCLGLPSFSNPTSAVWSLYHLYAILLPGFYPAFAVALTIGILSYIFTFQFLRECQLDPRWSSLLALGWSLQGFIVARTLASHINYSVLSLVPVILLMYLRPKLNWLYVFASAFVVAHTFYTGAVYFPFMLLAGLVLMAAILKFLDREHLIPLTSIPLKAYLLRSALMFFVVGLMTFAKILGVLNFSALFPRVFPLVDVNFWAGWLSSLSHQFYPLPWNHYELTGWWYRNWEAYIWLFPGLMYFVLVMFVPKWRERPVWRWVGAFVFVTFVGAITNSGILKPIVSQLPVLKSFHVNPRWTALTVISMLVLFVWAIRYLRWSLKGWQEGVLWLLFAGLPFYFIDDKDMAIEYPVDQYVAYDVGRALACYEPAFGYGLEVFPKAKTFNLLSFEAVDPRCYLASNRCEPGTFFKDVPNGSELNRQMKSYELRDEYPPVKYGKYPSLVFYLSGLLSLVYLAIRKGPHVKSED